MAVLPLSDGVPLLLQRGRVVRALLIAGLVLCAADAPFGLLYLDWAFDPARTVDPWWTLPTALLGLFRIIIYLTTAVFFAAWVYRAAANAIEAGYRLNDSPGWAVGWYFIPIANLGKPFFTMRQIWNASHGHPEPDDVAGEVTAWWAAWLITQIAGNLAMRITFMAKSFETLQVSAIIGFVHMLAGLMLYPLAIKLITAIDQGQDTHFDQRAEACRIDDIIQSA